MRDSAFGLAAGWKLCVKMRVSPFRHIVFRARNWNPRKSNEMTGKSPRRAEIEAATKSATVADLTLNEAVALLMLFSDVDWKVAVWSALRCHTVAEDSARMDSLSPIRGKLGRIG